MTLPLIVPEMVPYCRLRTGDPQMFIHFKEVFAATREGKQLLPGPDKSSGMLIFSAFPPRDCPPCFNMNERLPRLGLKHTGSFHSGEEKFRLQLGISALSSRP